LLHIYVDADGCPVKEEVCRVAKRYGLSVTLVANSWMRVREEPWLKLVVVDGGLNAADDWIAEHAGEKDIVITGDIPLASRCLPKGAVVLDARGGEFTEERIGEAMATRELLSSLRDIGAITGGPAPFDKRHRSLFLQRLDQAVHAIRKMKPPAPD